MASPGERRTQWLKGVLELCVLGTLRATPRYGYEIRQVLAAAGVGDIKGGTLYPVLGRLEDAGLVSANWRPGASGPNRKYYALTADGTAALRGLADDWQRFSGAVLELVGEVAVHER